MKQAWPSLIGAKIGCRVKATIHDAKDLRESITMSLIKKEQEVFDAILGTKKKARPSELGDLRWRARLFGGVLPEEIMERKHVSLEERLEKLEESKGNGAMPTRLTDREEKIWEVIQRGSRGLQYCRDLEAAHINPRRKGVWKDCPRAYPAAYKESQLWRHRIQDEKSRIQRKGLASE